MKRRTIRKTILNIDVVYFHSLNCALLSQPLDLLKTRVQERGGLRVWPEVMIDPHIDPQLCLGSCHHT